MAQLLFFSVVVGVVSSAPTNMAISTTTTTPTTRIFTTETPWFNLDGKMVFVSRQYGGISFFAPSRLRMAPTATPYTTASTTAGLSVCVRYVVGEPQGSNLFTISSSRGGSLSLRVGYGNQYQLTNGYRYSINLNTNMVLWPLVEQSLWTRICLTMDASKNVVQMFSGRQISARRILPSLYLPVGNLVIEFSGFDGQVTDVQMWDYPLSYREVFAYMNFHTFRPAGNVLTWSHISYPGDGRVLVEDIYERQAEQPFRGKLGKKRNRGFYQVQPKSKAFRNFK